MANIEQCLKLAATFKPMNDKVGKLRPYNRPDILKKPDMAPQRTPISHIPHLSKKLYQNFLAEKKKDNRRTLTIQWEL